jgi:hypothetical protein
MKTTHILIVLNLVITSGSLLFLLREMKKWSNREPDHSKRSV